MWYGLSKHNLHHVFLLVTATTIPYIVVVDGFEIPSIGRIPPPNRYCIASQGSNHLPSFSLCSSSPSSSSDVPLEATQDDTTSDSIATTTNNNSNNDDNDEKNARPEWMKCINGIAPRNGPLNEAVSRIANVSLEHANFLIGIGAVWARMDVLTEEQILDQYYESSPSAQVQYSDLPSGWHSGTNDNDNEEEDEEDIDTYIARIESRRYNRILTPTSIDQGTDIRIYPHPRRFPASDLLRDTTRLLHEDTTYLIVDKPPLLPTQPDASNYQECLPGLVERYLGGPFPSIDGHTLPRPLLCHRVDSCVGGCVVLSKDRIGQAAFERYQRERSVRKVYLAVTTQPVPLGRHIHWIWKDSVRRGNSGGPPCQLVSHSVPLNRKKAKMWVRCILEVVDCRPIEIKHDNGDDEIMKRYDPGTKQHYQSTIRLVTGRKHQVRTQLASLGCPIIRDTLYEPISGMTLDWLNEGGEKAMMMDEAVERCAVPKEPIGLQAHAILFGGIKARAGTPWWGDGTGN